MRDKPQSVLITGAEGALGSAVAAKFAKSGVRVYGTYFKTPPQKGAQDAPELIWVQADLTEPTSVKKAIGPLEVDALVHCAGGFRFGSVESTSDDDWNFLMGSNLKSGFLLARELIPGMKKRGFGRIVFISTRATQGATSAGMGPYVASKAGLNHLTSALADEVRSNDINVNAVMPTVIDTPANRRDMPKADFSTWVTPEALSEIIFSLTQPWGKPIHGALIPVAGRL